MKKIIIVVLIILSFPLLAERNKTSSFAIYGVRGKVLANVNKRLNELKLLRPLEQMTPEELRFQIIKAVQPFGYFKPEVTIQFTNKQNLKVNIQPGAQIHITSLKIELFGEGSQNPNLLKTVHGIPLSIGEPLDTDKYNQAKQNLANAAEALGFLHATYKKSEILIDESKNTARITLLFDTGPLYYFGQVQFDPTNINPDLLHRFVPFKPGQPYSTQQVLEFNNHLSGSGYFNSVLVNPVIGTDNSVPLIVHLQPVSKYSYTYGIGYGTDTGIRGRAALHVIPVNSEGHKFNAVAQGSFTQSTVQAQYLAPGANPVTDQYSLTGNYSNLNYNSGYSNSMLVSLAQQHNLEQYQRSLSVNALYESFHYSLQPNTDQFMLYPKASFTFKKTQNLLFSPSGYTVTINGLGANHATLSGVDFYQTSIDAKAAIMIEPLRLRLFGHVIQGITETKDINQIPLTLALLLGGADNLKAYSFNSIGPGKIISYAGFEIQKETVKNWYLVGFSDVGDVYNPGVRAMQYDVGAGLMWVSPIGPIKVGLAQAVDNRMQRIGGSNPRVVISMGPDL